MSIRNLDALFRPDSVAVVGASNGRGTIGAVIMDNLLAAGFHGPLMPVSADHLAIKGVYAYRSIQQLPQVPDLAVVISPAAAVPQALRELGERGARAAIIVTALDKAQSAAALAEARRFGLRLLGPDSIGIQVPRIGLNASLTHVAALPGKLALVSESSAMCTSVLDWAVSRRIGFSHCVAMGARADVDLGDVLDWLGSDGNTNAVLLHLETLKDPAKFISAARALSRSKPVLAIRTGRSASEAADRVYSAALRRAGVLRVHTIDEMFEAVETLSRTKQPAGGRIAILANSVAVGTLALDALCGRGAEPAVLSDETVARLREALGLEIGRRNPLDLPLGAPAELYARALPTLLDAPEVDSVLVVHAPGAMTAPEAVAGAVIQGQKAARQKKPLSACWLGADSARAARALLIGAGIPTFETPEDAVVATSHLLEHRHSQQILMETPSSIGLRFQPDVEAARAVMRGALAAGQSRLDESQAVAVLTAYGIPTAPTRLATDPAAAAAAADELGYPVALKIWSDDIPAKSEVRGVVLDLQGREPVRSAAEAMHSRVAGAFPAAEVKGFIVQRMARPPAAREVRITVRQDPTFGPVVQFGRGGISVGVLSDEAVTLPPLNMNLARDLIGQTRVARLLEAHGDRPAADLDAVAVALCRVAQMVVDVAELTALDLNPLLVGPEGVVAVDARITVAPPPPNRRLAIRPYPKELEQTVTLKDGRTVLVRPIRPEDEPAHHDFHARLSDEDIRFRHFGLVKAIPHDRMTRLTQIDYDREMAFIATDGNETLGVARAVVDPYDESCEFAIVIRSDLKGIGLGSVLLSKVADHYRDRGLAVIEGETMRENKGMIGLARHLGFTTHAGEDGIVKMTKVLDSGRAHRA